MVMDVAVALVTAFVQPPMTSRREAFETAVGANGDRVCGDAQPSGARSHPRYNILPRR